MGRSVGNEALLGRGEMARFMGGVRVMKHSPVTEALPVTETSGDTI